MTANELTALGVAIDALTNMRTAATDAWLEGRQVDARYIKTYTETSLAKIQKLRERGK